MELPRALRQCVEEALAHLPVSRLAPAARLLSERYRGEMRDGSPHLGDELAACAYLATRLPATYAAIAAAFAAVADMRPDFAPRTLLDIGAGPGTAMWAASTIWPVADALLIERSGAIRTFGEAFSASSPVAEVTWRALDATAGLTEFARRDLVVIGYVLNELAEELRDRLIDDSWALTSDMLIVIEPGTPAGFRRLMRARTRLLAAGAHLVAPCAHQAACPLREPDWCHFKARLPRSRLHRQVKAAEVPWEDEKFIYLAASREAGILPRARVIAAPKLAHGQVTLKLCCADGSVCARRFTRREEDAFKVARRRDWGEKLA